MPRDPKDISIDGSERNQRRLGELDDGKDPLRIRVGAGPAGAEGKEGKAGADGRSAGFKYKYSTNTEETDPGSGFVKFNNGTLDSATRIRLSETDLDTNAIAGALATWDDSTSEVKGQIIMRSRTNTARVSVFNVTGALTDNGTWDQIIIANVVTAGTFSNNEEVTLEFYRSGDKGSTGAEGAGGKEGPAGSAENNDWKNSVRAATTENITIATALNNADVIDGVTLATNDRVLVKNQTTAKENGIYVVGVSPARALDANAAGELTTGSTVYVEEGSQNGAEFFTLTTTGGITIGTTAIAFAAAGAWTAAGLTGNWKNYESADFAKAEYRKTRDGQVQLRGLVQPAATGQNNVFQLPVGFRPKLQQGFACAAANGAGNVIVRIDVQANGAIRPEVSFGGTTTAYYLFLDSISFFND